MTVFELAMKSMLLDSNICSYLIRPGNISFYQPARGGIHSRALGAASPANRKCRVLSYLEEFGKFVLGVGDIARKKT